MYITPLKHGGLLAALPLVGAGAMAAQAAGPDAGPSSKAPNVVLIVADDLGFGDVSAYGSKTISTPNIDRLANEGCRFNRAYATSATSTPSRYAMFTGLYPWKNANAKILPGDAPLLIPTDIPTLPKMMRDNGYATAAIGKWHLGMGNGNVDWNGEIRPGAKDVGFDYSCIIAATNDRVPTVYVEDAHVVGLDPSDPIQVSYEKNFDGEPTALSNPELLKMRWHHGHHNSIVNGIPRIGYMKGGKSARWTDEDMADYFVGKVKTFLNDNKDKPFFLYYGLHEPHVPRAPHSRFVGSTTMGPRGDAIVEADWCVGELCKELERLGLDDNTLIIFTSDNGPVLQDGYEDGCTQLVGDHKPAGGLRGGKYSLLDGGTHIPLFVYWKGKIQPTVSDALVSQLDFYASMANLIGAEAPAGLDSRDMLDVFMGRSDAGRDEMVIEAMGRLGLRYGDYVMLPGYKGPFTNEALNDLGNNDEPMLFNLTADPGQTRNLRLAEPEEFSRANSRFLDLTKGFYRAEVPEEKLQ